MTAGRHAGTLLPDVLTRRASLSPARQAYVFLDEHGAEAAVLTYGELHKRALASAGQLSSRCAPGERALLLFPPGLEFIVAFFGCLYSGIIAVPANPPRRSRLATATHSIAVDCQPSAVLTTSAMLQEAKAALPPAAAATVHWITVEKPGDPPACSPDPDFQPTSPAADAIAFLQYTSGSTAAPKGVMVSQGNVSANERMIARAFGHDEDSTVVGWAPFFHDQGLIGNVLQPPCAGATSILMSPMTFIRWPLRWLAAISRYRAHTSGGPNFAFDACVERAARADIPGLDLSSWKIAFNGAEPIRPETLRRFSQQFAPYGFRPESFYPCYGLAEATLFVTGSRKGRGARLLEADAEELGRGRYTPAREGRGQTLAGSGLISAPEWQEPEEQAGPDVQVVDQETGHPCPAGQVGEIWVSGPHVAQGYWRRPEATAASFHAALSTEPGRRYLRTGDLGFVADGELYVAGRLKDLVIIRGRNYYPQDIEHTVQSAHPALRPAGCAAFSVAGTMGERLVVVQEVKPKEALLAGVASIVSDIRAAVIRDYQLAVSDLVLTLPGQLQKTSSGKIMRAAARRRYLEAGFRAWAQPRGEQPRGEQLCGERTRP